MFQSKIGLEYDIDSDVNKGSMPGLWSLHANAKVVRIKRYNLQESLANAKVRARQQWVSVWRHQQINATNIMLKSTFC